MKIFIDGSTRSAVNRMFPKWIKLGHSIVDNYKDANIQLSVVKINVNNKLPNILRLDGVYYDKSKNYNLMNQQISNSHRISNGIIYQSYFSKRMCESYLKERNTKIFDVIHNGISDWNNFEEHDEINIVSCSKWRRPKRLNEIVYVFKEFNSMYPNSKLHIIGPMVKGSLRINDKNIIYYNRLSEIEIKNIYKKCDIYLHLCKRDSCPSSIIESISSGIPVITTNVCGGASEICQLTKGCKVIYEEEENLEADYIYTDSYNSISKDTKLIIVKEMVNIIKNKIRVTLPKELTIEYVAKKYIELMEKVI